MNDNFNQLICPVTTLNRTRLFRLGDFLELNRKSIPHSFFKDCPGEISLGQFRFWRSISKSVL